MDRRQALKSLVAAGVALAAVDRALATPPAAGTLRLSLDDARFAALTQINGTVEITNSIAAGIQTGLPGGFPLALVRVDQSTVTAVAKECTHSGCQVGTYTGSRFVCPCHSSRFDGRGAMVNGPALSPLTTYPVAFDGAVVTVSGLPGSTDWNLLVADAPSAPLAAAIEEIAPNPFRGDAVIRYAVSAMASVRIDIHDTAGRRVASLVDAMMAPGRYTAVLAGAALPAGAYLCVLHAGDRVQSQPMTKVP
jgi:cytochrome b6-f complex iron-sulfur subunit